MKILHISAVINWGGGENQIEVLCREFARKNPEINNLILCAKNGQFHKKLQRTSLKFITAKLHIRSDPRFVFRIISLCRQENFDLIHIHDSTALMLTVIAGNLTKLPPFVLSKKTSFPIKNRKQSLYKYNYKNIKKILCVSEATKQVAARNIKNTDKLEKVYHGIDFKSCSEISAKFSIRKRLNIPESTFIFGNIANHIRPKNLETLISTANELINNQCRTNVHFVQIGNFTERSQALQELVRKFGLEKYFSFLGYQENASAFIPQFNFSVLSSQTEGLPQFIYESFFHKIPVISTNVGGIPEVITHKKNGLLSPPHNEKKLCENLLFLMDNAECIPKFVEISHKILLKGFTSEIMAKNTLKVYKNVLDERS